MRSFWGSLAVTSRFFVGPLACLLNVLPPPPPRPRHQGPASQNSSTHPPRTGYPDHSSAGRLGVPLASAAHPAKKSLVEVPHCQGETFEHRSNIARFSFFRGDDSTCPGATRFTRSVAQSGHSKPLVQSTAQQLQRMPSCSNSSYTTWKPLRSSTQCNLHHPAPSSHRSCSLQ